MNKKRARCPVCDSKVNPNSQSTLLLLPGQLPWFTSRQNILELAISGPEKDSRAHRQSLYWACNNCISEGRAILGNPAQQTFCDYLPYFAYFDEKRLCESCGDFYIFTKEEQVHWYEKFKFWVQSRPKMCKPCYRARKQKGSGQPSEQESEFE